MAEFLPYFWIAVVVFMSICELATAQLVSVWFVIGAIAAFIASLFTGDILTQILVFVAVTVVTLVVTRPFVKRIKSFKKTETNSDRYIGRQGRVTVEINNELGQGQVNVEGSVWSARSVDNSVIEPDTIVTVERIEGVKFMVSKAVDE